MALLAMIRAPFAVVPQQLREVVGVATFLVASSFTMNRVVNTLDKKMVTPFNSVSPRTLLIEKFPTIEILN